MFCTNPLFEKKIILFHPFCRISFTITSNGESINTFWQIYDTYNPIGRLYLTLLSVHGIVHITDGILSVKVFYLWTEFIMQSNPIL